MDIFSHLFAVMCVFEKTKINEKEAEVGPFLKKQSEGHAFRYRRQKGKVMFNDERGIIKFLEVIRRPFVSFGFSF